MTGEFIFGNNYDIRCWMCFEYIGNYISRNTAFCESLFTQFVHFSRIRHLVSFELPKCACCTGFSGRNSPTVAPDKDRLSVVVRRPSDGFSLATSIVCNPLLSFLMACQFTNDKFDITGKQIFRSTYLKETREEII